MNLESNNNNPFDISSKTPVRTWKEKLIAFFIILVLLSSGISISYYFFKNKPKARKRHALITKTLVEVTRVKKSDVPVVFSVFGKVVPSRQITLTSRIPGMVKAIHKNFRPGGLIKKDEIIVALEESDYQSLLLRKKAVLDQAVADLRIEKGSQSVARNEWDEYKNLKVPPGSIDPDLILRKPQLEKAEAVVAAAKADLAKSEQDLLRTKIRAPFDALVRSKAIDVGSQITTQTDMGVLTGTDVYWVEIAVPVDRLKWLRVKEGDRDRSNVTIYASNGGVFEGLILSLHGEIERDGLMAKLLVEVKKPFKDMEKPLLLESFVRAELRGITLKSVYRIPRTALSEDNTVFVAKKDNTLDIRVPKVKWKDTDWVYISRGLSDNELMITTNIPAPIKGMPLEILKPKKVKKRVKIKRLKDDNTEKDKEDDDGNRD